jgi:hypothetical protein
MIVTIDNTQLDVFEDGCIIRKMRSGRWKEIVNKMNHNKGYNVILINKRQYMRSSIVAHVFLDYRLNEKLHFVSHLNLDRLDCQVSNLRLLPRKKIQ